MKFSAGILLVLLSSSAFAAQPSDKAAADSNATINPSVRGAFPVEQTRSQTRNIQIREQAAARESVRLPSLQEAAPGIRYSGQINGGYLKSAELVEADQMCVFNQASYTYSCR